MRVHILPPKHPPTFEADIAARLEEMRRAYKTASNKDDRMQYLLGALYLCRTFRPLPDWLFRGLNAELKAKLPNKPDLHGGRWLVVREGKQRGLTWEQAYQYASDQAAGTPGSARTMEESYKIFEAKLRGRKRKPRKRRR
jgi:hypothetical protein